MKAKYSSKQIVAILKDRIGSDWRQYMKTEVRKRRKERGLTQRKLAEICSCQIHEVYHLERLGYTYPKAWIAILKELQIECIEAP